jgi:predicted MFS family arabinose efflux permease
MNTVRIQPVAVRKMLVAKSARRAVAQVLCVLLTPVIAQRYGWTSSFMATAIFGGIGGIAWLLDEPERQGSLAGGSEPSFVL